MNLTHLYYIWLAACAPTGSALPVSLLKYFGSAERVYLASEEELSAAPVEWRGRMKPFLEKDTGYAERILHYCEENGVGISTMEDHFYPQRLRELSNPPLLFYHVGAFCNLDRMPSVSVVGTRTPTPYGERAAKRLCVDLARGGATLVSGLARGIDSLAHRAALYCDTFTVAVLGCGIDRVYPPEHRDLMAQVSEKGLLMTEYAPGTPPHAKNFPMRNRLIAALSPVTLVVEASAGSGSLITAEHALRLKKELFSVPSPIFSEMGAGANHLLRIGAKPALRAQDVLGVLAREYPDEISAKVPVAPKRERIPKVRDTAFAFPGSAREAGKELKPFSKEGQKRQAAKKPKHTKTSVLDLSEEERALLLRLTHEPVLLDTLADETTPASRLMTLVSSLEIQGHVERVGGNRVCLCDDAE